MGRLQAPHRHLHFGHCRDRGGSLDHGSRPGEHALPGSSLQFGFWRISAHREQGVGGHHASRGGPRHAGTSFTLLGSAAGAMMPIGLAIAGPLSDRLGIQTWFIVGGSACLVMSLLMAATPAVMTIEDEQRMPREPVEPQLAKSAFQAVPTGAAAAGKVLGRMAKIQRLTMFIQLFSSALIHLFLSLLHRAIILPGDSFGWYGACAQVW